MRRFELELNEDADSLDRIQQLFSHLYDILLIQKNDSFKGVEGGAVPHYIIKVDIEEKWI